MTMRVHHRWCRWAAILVLGACASDEDSVHPRTAQNLAKTLSRLPISPSATVRKYDDLFVMPSGKVTTQGTLNIEIGLDSLTVRQLLIRADALGYHRSAAASEDSVYATALGIHEDFKGRFLLELGTTTRANFIFVTLDSVRNLLTVSKVRVSSGW